MRLGETLWLDGKLHAYLGRHHALRTGNNDTRLRRTSLRGDIASLINHHDTPELLLLDELGPGSRLKPLEPLLLEELLDELLDVFEPLLVDELDELLDELEAFVPPLDAEVLATL